MKRPPETDPDRIKWLNPAHPESVLSPRGNRGLIFVRDETSDLSIVFGSFSSNFTAGGDEYGLKDLHVAGTILDIGSHIGTIALAVLLDNPGTKAVLVEPIPENMALARQTMAANGLTTRCTFIEAAVGLGRIRYGGDDAGDRFVGNIGSHDGLVIEAPVVTLDELVAAGHVAALKIDCEGGEWGFLASNAVAAVDLIFGEWHGHAAGRDGPAMLRERLGATHDLVSCTDVGGIGLFRAVRRG